jgi:hypothetical protein
MAATSATTSVGHRRDRCQADVAALVLDYREAGGLLWQIYTDTIVGAGKTSLKFGWPTLDAQAGGIEEGDVVVVAGGPSMGKTWLLVWSALSRWAQGRPVPFIFDGDQAEAGAAAVVRGAPKEVDQRDQDRRTDDDGEGGEGGLQGRPRTHRSTAFA